MTSTPSSGPVVVGIDGSLVARTAADWAVEEALSRDVALRLVFATKAVSAPGDLSLDIEYEFAEESLRTASAAIEALGKPVKLETAIDDDAPSAALIAESDSASLICVGSVGIGWVAERILGSTAAEVAERAHCPVLIVRDCPDDLDVGGGWIALAVNASGDEDFIVEAAVAEARRHGLPVLAVGVWQADFGDAPYEKLEQRVADWRRRYPDVCVRAVLTDASLPRYLAEKHERVRLAVIGPRDTDQIESIVGPREPGLVPHGDCSVLVARG